MYRTHVLWVGLVVGLTGCLGSQKDDPLGRSQIGEDPAADAEAFATVGSKTMPDQMGPIPVSGVGLVYNLQPGTGSSAPAGGWRAMLENTLKKQGFSNLKAILDDPNRTTSLVLVSALVPPGARQGDPVDVQIALPEGSKTTSLKGGKLLACELVEYDTTGNLSAVAKGEAPAGPSGGLVLGSTWVTAEGPVVAGSYVAPGDEPGEAIPGEPANLTAGRIWDGGRITQARPYLFVMNPGDRSVRTAANVSERLNSAFDSSFAPDAKVAEVRSRELVLVNVPYAYRHNHYRFLLVARQVPIIPVAGDSLYRRQLEDDLLDPAKTLVAAVKLEALGTDSRRGLRLGLESPSAWVRFAAAESLAYLGYTDGAAELADLAKDHPAIRAQCLKALTATDDAAFTDRLAELMASPDADLRYGAFIALRLANHNHPATRGRRLNHSLWVHRAAPGSPGLIHVTSTGRSEVVIFGDGVELRGPVPPLPIGNEFTISMSADENEVRITRIVKENGEPEVKETRCPPNLERVFESLARLGGGYAEAVELLKRADAAQVLTAAVALDAVPRQMSVQTLASLAGRDPGLVKADVEVAQVGTVRTDMEAVGVDLPSIDNLDDKPVVVAPVRAPLSRSPGRLFGTKARPEVVVEPLAPVVPVEATEPTDDPEPTADPQRSRNPGTLFGRK